MKLLNIKQLSEKLNVKPRTIYDWKYKRQIPFIKLGKLLRFDEEIIDKWLKKKAGKIFQP